MAEGWGFVLGNGGHGRLIASRTSAKCLGLGDPVPESGPVYIGVGDAKTRRRLFNEFRDRVRPVIFEKHLSGIAATVAGFQGMNGVIIMHGCKIGENVLVNTGAQIDHECIIGDHCVRSPGAILCGNVTLGEECEIGAGSIIVQGVSLSAFTRVPAGSLVVGPTDIRRHQRLQSYIRQADIGSP